MKSSIGLKISLALLAATTSLGCPALRAESNQTSTPQYRVGRWLPSDQVVLDNWLVSLSEQAKKTKTSKLSPAVNDLKNLIETDPELYMLFNQMYEQIPLENKFSTNPAGGIQPKNYMQMLNMLNQILTTAPEFNQTGLVGFPINAILNWNMGTEAGSTAFLNNSVNEKLKIILNQWSKFLESPESTYVLNDHPENGWFGKNAMAAMPTFTQDFISDPKKKHYGFKSWDDFFTRRFRPGRRPVADPENDNIIVSSCESAPYSLVKNVKYTDKFWIKSQPYSLLHVFNDSKIANSFAGGTVYQAFLSALSYHRWHSPVSGKVLKTYLLDGSYYAADPTMGFDPASPNASQGFLPQVAARAVILIEADNPKIGTMAAVYIGMSEVSSNEFTVNPGDIVKKGDQIGMFHYGGSSHLLIFKPGVNLEFDLRGQTPGLETKNILVRSKLASVVE